MSNPASFPIDDDAGAGARPTPPAPLDATADWAGADSQAARLVDVLDQCLADLKAGQPLRRDELLAAHPELAEQLDACLAGIEFIHGAGGRGGEPPAQLGDFRIVREVGRGGMGAVYEAEQVSLGRRVALKVLRFGGVSDPEAVQRFQREAETVARLHHTNIVPIFAVGSERGVNYYAMQFIEGRSLDRVLAEAGGPLDADTVVEWGLGAAEALAHAHARGVIHRDVKPSNILIDRDEGRVWLTDFGLAKRADDVTLSMAGALLGTPRYMSPEQASATTQRIDHRTDLYSLGATLYELATGRPVFAASTPHGVISQILTSEPTPPRRHRPSLPRDLETILLKCLAREPERRYDSARQLANDLRALRDGRPISARATGPVELAARWVKRQRRSVALTLGAVAATLLLVAVAGVGGYAWLRSQLAFVTLNTDTPPLVAEFLAADGRVAAGPAIVPTLQTLEVPAGDYQLRLSRTGRLSETILFSLTAGQRSDQKLALESQLLWSDTPYDRRYRLAPIVSYRTGRDEAALAAPLAPRTDVLLLTAAGLQLRGGADGHERWSLPLGEPSAEGLSAEQAQLIWPWDRAPGFFHTGGVGALDSSPLVATAADVAATARFDFDFDGVSDLVVALRHQPCLLAVSGSTGKVLWAVARGSADPAAPASSRNADNDPGGATAAPLPVGDVDGDGVCDLAAPFVRAVQHGVRIERWIELISGASGQSLWRYDLPAELFALPPCAEAPYDLRWFYSASGGFGSGGSGRTFNGNYAARELGRVERSGPHVYLPGPWRVDTSPGEVPRLRCVAGTHLVTLDARTGQPANEPLDLAVRAGLPPQWADLDGDGQLDLLLVEQLPDLPAPPGLMTATPQTRVTAWSPAVGRVLWQYTSQAAWPGQADAQLPRPAWPAIAHLAGEGAVDVLLPDEMHARDWYSPPLGGLVALDGRTGQPRWRRRLLNLDRQLNHFTVGPDIDGDGVAEVFVASLWGQREKLFVDCLSGADGATLWRAHETLHQSDSDHAEHHLADVSWRAAGSDGWPELIVSVRGVRGEGVDRLLLFSSGGGRLSHRAPGVAAAELADFDGDGLDDLLLVERRRDQGFDGGGVLHAVRGGGREPWRLLVAAQQAVGDLDGDGVVDLIEEPDQRRLVARSGASGRVLWHASSPAGQWGFLATPAAEHDPRTGLFPTVHDLDGDGVPDLLLHTLRMNSPPAQPVLWALSGRTGRILWEADFRCQVFGGVALLELRDLDGDDRPEVVLAAALDYGLPVRQNWSGNDASLHLFVIEGRTGEVRWRQPLAPPRGGPGGPQPTYVGGSLWLEAAYADLNGDGVLDLVLPAECQPRPERLEYRALSGVDGALLWQFTYPEVDDLYNALSSLAPAVAADFDGDGQPEVALLTIAPTTDPAGVSSHELHLHLLDGRTRQIRWQWRAPCAASYGAVRGQADRVADRLRPVLVRRGDGKHWLAVTTKHQQRRLHVIDDQGQLVSEAPLSSLLVFSNDAFRPWALDIDGDGADELAFLDGPSLRVAPADRLAAPLWRRPAEGRLAGSVVGVLPDSAACGRIVVRGSLGENSLRGYDAATGRLAWTTAAPVLRNQQAIVVPNEGFATLLAAPDGDRPPLARYQHRPLVVARQGVVFRDEAGGAAPLDIQLASRPHSAAVLPPVEGDPRLLCPLPWRPNDHEIVHLLPFVGWGLFYGATLIVAPASMLIWLARRRQWGLRTMFALPVVAAIVLMGVMVQGPDNDFHWLGGKLAIGAILAPPVALAAYLLGSWLWRGRWRLALAWLAAGLALCALQASLLLLVAPFDVNLGLPEDSRWSWEGWYWILPPGYFLLAWLTLMVAPLWWTLHYLIRRLTRRPSAAASS